MVWFNLLVCARSIKKFDSQIIGSPAVNHSENVWQRNVQMEMWRRCLCARHTAEQPATIQVVVAVTVDVAAAAANDVSSILIASFLFLLPESVHIKWQDATLHIN